MMKRRIVLALGLLMAVALLAACGPAYQIIAQAVPNPMLGKNGFAVMPIDFTGLRVGEKSEAEWMSEKDADAKSSWEGDKKGMNDRFGGNLISEAAGEGITVVPGPAQQPFVVQAKAIWAEPGFFAGIVSAASELELNVRITTPDGTLIDEIRVKTAADASMYDPASGTRLRHCAEAAGSIVADYLKVRVKGEQ
jgi:hypothetical protein